MSVPSTVILGVISGIITSIVIWLIVQIFTSILVPWFESIVYKGIDLSGNWKSSVQLSPSKYKANLEISINQKGHRLKGEIRALYINTEDNSERRKRRLNFTGLISDNNIVITYNSADKTVTSLGVFLLKQYIGGEQLKGTMVASDRLSEGIVSYEDIVWKRDL